MAEQGPQDDRNGRPPERRFRAAVARKAERHRRAQRERDRGVWYSVGLFGLIGWSVAVPAIAGIALGLWIDAHWPSRVSWTLTLLFLGIVMGCINAWHWIKQESREQ